MLTGFSHKQLTVDNWIVDILIAGKGSPLLLLHGFPETKFAWHKIARSLADTHTVVLADLPGYGDSIGPKAVAGSKNYTKRNMAKLLVQAMGNLGFDRFAVAGHDRGGRVAYRMALDHPLQISDLAVLNIIPTLEMTEKLDYDVALEMENWFFLAKPAPFPETMLKSNASYYLQYILNSWSSNPSAFSQEAKDDYLRCFQKPEVIAGICAEYRAVVWDIQHDNEDRIKNRRIQCPVHVLWSPEGLPVKFGEPLTIWKRWAEKVSGTVLPGGHFLMEENPEQVLKQLQHFFSLSLNIEI